MPSYPRYDTHEGVRMKLGRAGIAVSTMLLTLAVSSSAAFADGVPAPVPARDVTESTIALSENALQAGTNDAATAAERLSAQSDFTDDQARLGKLVDISDTEAAVVDGVSTVWERGTKITDVSVKTAVKSDTGNAVAQSFEVVGYADPASEDTSGDIGDDGVTAGLGLSGLASASGGKWLSGNCTTTSKSGDKLTSCYEKYKIKTSTASRDYYYYGRWATAVETRTAGSALTPSPPASTSGPTRGRATPVRMSPLWSTTGRGPGQATVTIIRSRSASRASVARSRSRTAKTSIPRPGISRCRSSTTREPFSAAGCTE
jgi:hypothetical protein